MTPLLTVLLLTTAAAGLPPQGPQQGAPFSLSDPISVAFLARDVDLALAEDRPEEAARTLQTLIEDHAVDLIRPEGSSTWTGGAAWARARLDPATASQELLAAYEQAFGPRADAALAAAGANEDAWMDLAGRWPGTRAAATAVRRLADHALERGDTQTARAWIRRQGNPGPRMALLEAIEAAASMPADWASVAGPADPVPPAPLPSGDPVWSVAYPNNPFRTYDRGSLDAALVVDEGRLFGTDTAGAFCLDLFTGDTLWRFKEAAEWDGLSWGERRDYFGAVNDDGIQGGSVGHGVFVVPLQVPLKIEEDERYHGYQIRAVLPVRRLHAFDTTSGDLLWTHWRPATAQLGLGGLEDTTTVVAPPIVDGDRVMALLARLHGQIYLNAAAFDAATGALIWATPLVTGMKEANMFGNTLEEYVTAPPVLHDGVLHISTHLGVMCAVNALDGAYLWAYAYDTVPLPQNHDWRGIPRRTRVWQNGPPAIAGSLVVAAPQDSEQAYALDRHTGQLAWRLHYDRIGPGVPPNMVLSRLVGANGRTVVFSGPGGTVLVDAGPPMRIVDHWQDRGGGAQRVDRGVVGANAAVVPAEPTLLRFTTGAGLDLVETKRHGALGNLVAADGVLLCATSTRIQAWFEWGLRVKAARRDLAAAGPDQAAARSLDLVRVLLRHAQTSPQARDEVAEARRILDRLDERGPLRGRTARAAADLEERSGDRLASAAALRWGLTTTDASESVRLLGRLVEVDPGRADTHLAELLRKHPDRTIQDQRFGTIPVPVWTLVQRIAQAEMRERGPVAIARLHELRELRDSGTIEGVDSDIWILARETALLDRYGPVSHRSQEKEAGDLLARAVETDDAGLLDQVMDRFPLTKAARGAQAAHLRMAWESGAADLVAAATRSLASGAPDLLPPDLGVALEGMALAWEKGGNARLAGALRARPAAGGVDSLRSRTPPPLPPLAAPLTPHTARRIARSPVAVLEPTGDPMPDGTLLLAAANTLSLRSLTPDGATRVHWQASVPGVTSSVRDPSSSVQLQDGRLTVMTDHDMICVDIDKGRRLWRRDLPDQPSHVIHAEGLMVVVSPIGDGQAEISAYDTYLGHELWRRRAPGGIPAAVGAGSGRLVIVPPVGEDIALWDLHLGCDRGTLTVPGLGTPRPRTILIRDAILILPRWTHVSGTHTRLQAFDLDRGVESWEIEWEKGLALWGMFDLDDRGLVAVVLPRPMQRAGPAVGGGLHLVDPLSGQSRRLAGAPPGTEVLGLPMGSVVAWTGPDLYLLDPGTDGFYRLRQVPLKPAAGPSGWIRRLPVPIGLLHTQGGALAQPVRGRDVVVPLIRYRPDKTAPLLLGGWVLDPATGDTLDSPFEIRAQGFLTPGTAVLAGYLAVVVDQKLRVYGTGQE